MVQTNNKKTNSDKKDSKIRIVWNQLDFWLGPVKPIFDIAVIIVMVLSLLLAYKSIDVALNANKLTRQALRISYIPWPKLVGFSIASKNNNLVDFHFKLKNYSPTAPAISLTMRSMMPKILNEQATYKKDALMPGEEGEQLLTLSINSLEEKATIRAVQTGKLPVRIVIICSDIFGSQYTVEQEFKKIGDQYRFIEYLPKGINLGEE